MRNKILDAIFVICIIVMVAVVIIGPNNINFDFPNMQRNDVPTTPQQMPPPENRQVAQTQSIRNKSQIITINPEIPLSYKTKQEIYDIRKSYVAKSIFNSENYTPSEEVFGQIEDYKPWLSTQRTKTKEGCNVQGNSAHSREIVNPSLLVSIDWPYYFEDDGSNQAKYNFSLLPDSAYYNSNTNEINVEYSKLPVSNTNCYMLNGINARDLGYKYAHIDFQKSKNLPKFIKDESMLISFIEFQDFFHTGGSCGVAGGCNNWSPYQPYLNFIYNMNNLRQTNKIYIKFWKERPENINNPADIIEIITLLPFNPNR